LSVSPSGHVIEGITTEHSFSLEQRHTGSSDKIFQVLSLQRACTVSDQHFSSYAILNIPGNTEIRTSRLPEDKSSDRFRLVIISVEEFPESLSKSPSFLAAISTITAVTGFIVQFVGLRALHWSATIIQLGITLLMTALRAWVRRGLASDPSVVQILDGHEKAWLALWLSQLRKPTGNGPTEHNGEDSGSPENL